VGGVPEVIAIGATVRASFGTYRVHRVTAAEVVLQDLERLSAFVVRRADQLGDLEIVTPAAIAIAAPPPARARGALPWPTTLGASRPGAGFCSLLPGGYWTPCLRRGVEEGSAEPHVWYIADWGDGTMLCDVCYAAAYLGTPAHTSPEQVAPITAPPPPAPYAPGVELGPLAPVWTWPAHRHQDGSIRERWSERAAIVEYLAGEERGQAEAIAHEMLVAELASADAARRAA
jgi:hypothetical protein